MCTPHLMSTTTDPQSTEACSTPLHGGQAFCSLGCSTNHCSTSDLLWSPCQEWHGLF